jgi:hypothetical protein
MRLVLIILFALLGFVPVIAPAGDQPLAVIVPLQHAGTLLDTRELMLIFKRKKLFWEGGVRIHPVNLPAGNPWRRQFSQSVLKNLPEQQMQYWNAMYYHGVFPPHVADSPEAVLRFVAETRGAIGYVPACLADTRVKSILWIGTSGAASDSPPELDCSLQ